VKNYIFFLVPVLILLISCTNKRPILKIGLVADPQYADQPRVNNRYYGESLWKLEAAVDTFNRQEVDFVQTLGDVIDGKWESFDSILPVYQKLKPGIKSYQLLGNHDFDIDSIHQQRLLERLGMPNYYYSYSKNGWRFIVLDATDYSFYSNPLRQHDEQQIKAYYEKAEGQPNHRLWNSAIGEEQQNWLRQELAEAELGDQKVILFSHLPLRPQGDAHNLWNGEEMIRLLENSAAVVAFINGHNHAGAYTFKNGIHYITVFGMVDTMIGSYGILELYPDSLILQGYGHQKTLRLAIE